MRKALRDFSATKDPCIVAYVDGSESEPCADSIRLYYFVDDLLVLCDKMNRFEKHVGRYHKEF